MRYLFFVTARGFNVNKRIGTKVKNYLAKLLSILKKSWRNYLALNEYFIHAHCFYTHHIEKRKELN